MEKDNQQWTRFKLGQPLDEDILSKDGSLLFPKGTVVTEPVLHRIKQHGFRRVHADEGDDKRHFPLSSFHYQHQRSDLARSPYSDERAQQLQRLINASSKRLTELASALLQSRQVNLEEIGEISNSFKRQADEDIDQTVATTLKQVPSRETIPHCITLGVLGMLIAQEIPGYSDDEVYDIGIAGTLHEVGVHELEGDERIRQRSVALQESEFLIYARHPLIAYELAEKIPGLSQRAKIGLLHVHEQIDGSGFPDGIGGRSINRVSRVLNVADAFLTLLRPVDGRRPIYAYDALLCILHQVKAGRCDAAAVRGLLNLVSLFPLGSLVRLSDSRVAKVLCSNFNYTKPTVEIVDTLEIVDLQDSDLVVVAMAEEEASQAQRLSRSDFDKPYWMPEAHVANIQCVA
ncbi:MAG: HD domain-containing phosphohydrolase [Pirellulaceae bacterium]